MGEFDGHSRRVLSCAFKPTRPFRIVTCGEDFLVNFYEGPPFKFKLSHRLAAENSMSLYCLCNFNCSVSVMVLGPWEAVIDVHHRLHLCN